MMWMMSACQTGYYFLRPPHKSTLIKTMMPLGALEAHAGLLTDKPRANALTRTWSRMKPMDMQIFSVYPSNICSAIESEIATRVYPFIQRLARNRKPMALKNRICINNRPFAHQRMLAAFGQCTGTPNFVIHLSDTPHTRATDAMQWIRLYSSAIRCSMGNCDTGFVFIDWILPSNRFPHTMLLCFDNVNKTQLLIDPSGKADVFHSMFNKQHIWDPSGIPKMFEFNSILAFKRCLTYNAETQRRNEPLEELELRCDEATLLILIAWTCLRFGYKDIAAVTRSIVCAFCEHQRQYPKHFFQFWELMRVWRNELRLEALTHDDLLYLLGLKVVNNDQPCGYQMDDVQVCNRRGNKEHALCETHQPESMTLAAMEPEIFLRDIGEIGNP